MNDETEWSVRCDRGWITPGVLHGVFRVQEFEPSIYETESEARRWADIARRQFEALNCYEIAASVRVSYRSVTTVTTYGQWQQMEPQSQEVAQ